MKLPRDLAATDSDKALRRADTSSIRTTPEFDALAQEARTALKRPAAAVRSLTDPAACAQLRAEMEALIAHLYGLTESEFADILTTFPPLRRGRENRHASRLPIARPLT